MQVSKSFLSTTLNGYNQYVIPVFQRHYSWNKNNWKQLWDSVIGLYENRSEVFNNYFMGSMVFIQESSSPNQFYIFKVIDGQQRLLTVTALLIALRNVAKNKNFDKLAEKIDDMLIFKPDFKKEFYRIQPRYLERLSYESLIKNSNMSNIGEMGVIGDVVDYFYKKINHINNLNNSNDDQLLENLYTIIITRLEFVDIVLDNRENVYRVFKNLNSTGTDLTEGDLIRGFVFENVELDKQDWFNEYYWKKLEHNFKTKKDQLNNKSFVQFFQHYLMMKARNISEDQIFKTFESDFNEHEDKIGFIENIIYFSNLYNYILGNKKYDIITINYALEQFRKLKDTAGYPFVLKMLHYYEIEKIDDNEFSEIVNMVMSFIIRRLTCGDSGRSYGSLFLILVNALEGNNPVNNVAKILLSKGFPTNEMFEFNLINNSYHTKHYRLILENIEKIKNSNEIVDFTHLQIEHIMPKTLGEEWKMLLGQDYTNIHRLWLNSIGNLTLTGYNNKLYNHIFSIKKENYIKSNITITRELSKYDRWTDIEIKDRGKEIADMAVKIYPIPEGNNHKYNKSEKTSKYVGVSLHRREGKWRSQIRKDGANYHLGYYTNEIDAAIAYNKKAVELYGENAKINEINCEQ